MIRDIVEEKKMIDMLSRSLDKAIEKMNSRRERIRISDELRAAHKRQEVLVEVTSPPETMRLQSLMHIP